MRLVAPLLNRSAAAGNKPQNVLSTSEFAICHGPLPLYRRHKGVAAR
jgi:hypothetical protein